MPFAKAVKVARRYWDEQAQAFSEQREKKGGLESILELTRLLMTVEVEEWHLKYSEYVAMLKRAGLKTFNVEFVPQEVNLSRFERTRNEEAQKLLQEAKRFDEKERFADAAIISSVKSKRIGGQPLGL